MEKRLQLFLCQRDRTEKEVAEEVHREESNLEVGSASSKEKRELNVR
jgi:predicted protein tyrosine phosphatase